MKIGVVGLGLIGGSLARAIKEYTDHKVCGADNDPAVITEAYRQGVIDSDTDVSGCDIVFVCLYPRDTVEYILQTSFKPGCIVADICGIKRFIAANVSAPLREKNVHYVGCHPMAGKETSGFANSEASLFQGASFIITHDKTTDQDAQNILADLAKQIGFTRITHCSAQKHDEVIGYTSQLAHIVSNAYVKSKAAEDFCGFSAGSFMDLTRVAKLNPVMWSELFTENSDILTAEIDELIKNITALRDAVAENDEDTLRKLLQEGSEKKEQFNRECK
ncbi:MAG: prephenate dehydrogenase/arogenate dehydrogenase family protein [Christensenella sp.]|nr:prephenate dehydrogenase/arogenate dehydrogenase family protein [Christensenella sp.]